MAEPVLPIGLTESTTGLLALGEAEAADLERRGRQLASRTTWWGDQGDAQLERSIIKVSPAGGGRWSVRVIDAIGVIAVGDATVVVEPKIETSHLLYILSHAQIVPRLDPQRLRLASDLTFQELMAHWLLDEVEGVVRQDLIRDYRPTVAAVRTVRGRVAAAPTAISVLSGRIEITCEHDEFDADNPVNRVLLAAVRRVGRSTSLSTELQRRARRLTLRFDGVGPLRDGDAHTAIERRTRHYHDAFILARSVLLGQARGLGLGTEPSWSFLVRTPEPVEAGITAILSEGLQDHSVVKRAITLDGSTRRLNPDLVFDDGRAVGDVKYKLTPSGWGTADLYQAVAFAAGFRAPHALIISFSSNGRALPPLRFGDIQVTHVSWDLTPGTSPQASAKQLVRDVGRWLDAGAGW